MNIINIEHISKIFGDKVIFKDAPIFDQHQFSGISNGSSSSIHTSSEPCFS